MDVAALQKIEDQLGIVLPAEYCSFISNYPRLDVDWEQSQLEEAVRRDPVPILSDNSFLRDKENGPFAHVEIQGFNWQECYFVIGTDGSGSYYFLDTSESPSPVLLFDCNLHEVEVVANDIDGLFARIKRTIAEVNSWDEK